MCWVRVDAWFVFVRECVAGFTVTRYTHMLLCSLSSVFDSRLRTYLHKYTHTYTRCRRLRIHITIHTYPLQTHTHQYTHAHARTVPPTDTKSQWCLIANTTVMPLSQVSEGPGGPSMLAVSQQQLQVGVCIALLKTRIL